MPASPPSADCGADLRSRPRVAGGPFPPGRTDYKPGRCCGRAAGRAAALLPTTHARLSGARRAAPAPGPAPRPGRHRMGRGRGNSMTDWTSLRYAVVDVEGNGQQPPDLVELAIVPIIDGT